MGTHLGSSFILNVKVSTSLGVCTAVCEMRHGREEGAISKSEPQSGVRTINQRKSKRPMASVPNHFSLYFC